MRQQLFPLGQVLYCANVGIPIHHFHPTVLQGLKVPAPGPSRLLVELLKRLGEKMPITRGEPRGAQAQLNKWKQAANPASTVARPPSSSPSKNDGPMVKPMNLIVLTDGEPDRGQGPEQVIVNIG
ncbi:uncharacterized protein PGTG_18095 [Puccinia graminis f. sp. tritici CRL 75-36-700-3]|uniref:Uncharacterized protein n=1 Tax=Puccinia graminis f. sp. tritici (strain CRL 75-36-700-3 / race SCCL) TaxID=418459 RepID=E3L6M3_PUCGT|nr:uncharacterized protein PGTG_18095 [Puccinia graminis f. sp. tritici CRL 75-36-700-3]EFP92198.1 hypothetical protein PGTG_18095 [Puccinia graminis f. sp. tritici CRL 75-36-700-3]